MAEQILLAFVAALLLTLLFGPLLIPLLRFLKFGQNIRAVGPQSHQKKAGTPTMGGLIFLAGLTAGSLLAAEWPFSAEILILVGTALGFALIGFWDDYIKVVKKRSLGLRAYQKLLGQFLLAGILCLLAVRVLGRGTDIAIPFTAWKWQAGWLYYPFVAVLIVFINNAVNLTDGLDGLAAGCTLISSLAYLAVTLLPVCLGGRTVFAQESNLAFFAAALAGCCLGFLRYNTYPAKVFMGDTGSLGLGGALAGLAVLSKSEAVLLIIGGIFVLEALSVIIQVISFQTTGKRVFRMSPLHHHFELGGWSEWKVVLVFWTVSLCFAIMGVVAVLPAVD
jgi:phospho-N-acetylmuramoyl-pentapeptide-transferase